MVFRIQIPCNVRFTQMVEDFVRSAGQFIFEDDRMLEDNLCTVMNELFTNIVKHSDNSRRDSMVRIQLSYDRSELAISMLDFGPGFEVENHKTPYPAGLIGHREVFRRVLDGTVYLQIKDHDTIRFFFEDSGRLPDPSQLRNHGYGLSIMTKLMDSVEYTHLEKDIYDWRLKKRIHQRDA